MEGTLTDLLINIRNDLSQLKRVREYLDENAVSEGKFTVTWQTIEAFNSILSACSSQVSPQTEALNILLDSFYYLSSENKRDGVWNHFGYELGVICVKILAAIEQTDKFEDLFCKLLEIVDRICQHNSDLWKATGRQILNVLINKKFSFSYLEKIQEIYVSILRKVDTLAVKKFAEQNLSLLKTLSMSVKHLGDFESQANLTELIFLHVTDKKFMEDFFTDNGDIKILFRTLNFSDFEEDCRTFLNALNKKGIEKKIFSVCCNVIYIGGYLLEPPVGKKAIWIDANKDSERLSLKFSNFLSNPLKQRVLFISFSDVVEIKMENLNATKESYCLTIKTQSLKEIFKECVSDIYCTALEEDNTLADILEFVNFLKNVIQKKQKKKNGSKVSQTCDYIFIERNTTQNRMSSTYIRKKNQLQDSAISSSVNIQRKASISSSINIQRNALLQNCSNYQNITENKSTIPTLREISENEKNSRKEQFSDLEIFSNRNSPVCPIKENNFVSKIKNKSTNSFAESFNKNVGAFSPETHRIFEDSVPTVEFIQNSGSTKKCHKLFRSPEKIFNFFEDPEDRTNLIFEANKENESPKSSLSAKTLSPNKKKYEKKSLPHKNISGAKLFDSQSEDYFRNNNSNFSKKKPTLPKMKKRFAGTEPKVQKTSKRKKPENKKLTLTPKNSLKKDTNENKPSLLDPNGYAYRRWLKPTTSERSNFWLKKLDLKEKEKAQSDRVFDFSQEDSETDWPRNKKLKKNVKNARTLKKKNSKETKKTSLNSITKILRSGNWKLEAKEADQKQNKKNGIGTQMDTQTKCAKVPKIPLKNNSSDFQFEIFLEKKRNCYSLKETCPEKITVEKTFNQSSPDNFEQNYDNILKCRSSFEESDESNIIETVLKEKKLENQLKISNDHILSSEDEDLPEIQTNKKRERSEGESSIAKGRMKKKSKAIESAFQKPLPPALRRCVEKAEEKAKQQTDEIIETISKATNHLLNHIQKKEKEKLATYLKTAEEAVDRFQEGDELGLRHKRTEKVLAYYRLGCSVSGLIQSLDARFAEVQNALKDFTENTDVFNKMIRINDRLKYLIESEIDRSIRKELKSRHDRIMRCMSEV